MLISSGGTPKERLGCGHLKSRNQNKTKRNSKQTPTHFGVEQNQHWTSFLCLPVSQMTGRLFLCQVCTSQGRSGAGVDSASLSWESLLLVGFCWQNYWRAIAKNLGTQSDHPEPLHQTTARGWPKIYLHSLSFLVVAFLFCFFEDGSNVVQAGLKLDV